MPMLVMNIRHVRVGMLERSRMMRMGVRLAAVPVEVMRVVVVRIMPVTMRMVLRGMTMAV